MPWAPPGAPNAASDWWPAWMRAAWPSTPRRCWRWRLPWAWSSSSTAAAPPGPKRSKSPNPPTWRRTSAATGRHAAAVRRHGKTARHARQRLPLHPDHHGRPAGRRAAAQVRRRLPHLRRRAAGVARPPDGARAARLGRRVSRQAGNLRPPPQVAARLRRRRRHALRLRLAVRPAGHRVSRVHRPRQGRPRRRADRPCRGDRPGAAKTAGQDHRLEVRAAGLAAGGLPRKPR